MIDMTPHEIHYHWEWQLRATPEQLWPYVSDTQRFNRVAVGYRVQPSSATDEDVQHLRASYVIPLAWEEHPFEWDKPHHFSVRRRFQGPLLRDFSTRTTLTPNTQGTLLLYEITARPASLLGKLAIPLQIGLVSHYRFGRAFRRIDDFLQHPTEQLNPLVVDKPFITGEAARRLHDIGRELESDGYPAALIDRLTQFITQADDDEVAHLRPYALADRWHAPRRAMLELCLAATRRSLLDLRWDIVCPMCRGANMSVSQLNDIHEQAYCPSCHMDFHVNFDHAVEVTFRPNGALRPIDVGTYCVGGPQLTPHVVAQQLLAAHETRTLQLALEPGAHRLRARVNVPRAVSGHVDLRVSSEATDQPATAITLRINDQGWGADHDLATSNVALTMINDTPYKQGVVLERVAWNDQAVTAADVSTLQAFRDWFASQALRPDVQLGITNLAVLFTDLRGSTQLYREIGDAPAFERVLEHFEVLRRSVDQHAGAQIKTIGDAIMAAFLDPAQGVAAGLEILRGMAQLNQTRTDYPLRLKLGLHTGAAIAVTLNERLDYFGTTVNIASRLEGQAQGDDLIISEDVMRQSAVQRVLEENEVQVEMFKAQLKGFVNEEFQLYRIRLQQ
jgi:adenylate cyclase